jgi:hypothetical protein
MINNTHLSPTKWATRPTGHCSIEYASLLYFFVTHPGFEMLLSWLTPNVADYDFWMMFLYLNRSILFLIKSRNSLLGFQFSEDNSTKSIRSLLLWQMYP